MKTCRFPCHKKATNKGANGMGWISSLAVALLPKCPFCIMAYTGAITMCSGSTIYPNQGSSAIYISLGLSTLIFFSLLLNYRDQRTHYALVICTIAICFVLLSQHILHDQILYFLGSGLLIFSIWLNGSFLYVFNKFIKRKETRLRTINYKA